MITSKKKPKSWKETNKVHKEEKKLRKEQKLAKRVEEDRLKELESEKLEAIQPVETENISTISIAVPGSILDNAQSAELRTYLAGQIARAACMFQVDEIIVFDDHSEVHVGKKRKESVEDHSGTKMCSQSSIQLGRILQYLECPQYLRKHFFPIHNDLKYAGILNPLDAPHHLRQHNNFVFREGVVTNKPVKHGRGSLVNVGLQQDVQVDKLLTSGIRCTVKLSLQEETSEEVKKTRLRGIIVPPSQPRQETGIYWGYSVRLANSLSQVFTQSPYKDGYDITIGTSDKGSNIDDFNADASNPPYEHCLVMFGGLYGLETALDHDESLTAEDPSLLFDHYLNTLPAQGSRTLRTEEAILVTLAALRGRLEAKVTVREFTQVDEIAQSAETGVLQ